jgi:hypothetical protein
MFSYLAGILAFLCSPPCPEWLYDPPNLLANGYGGSGSKCGQNKNPAIHMYFTTSVPPIHLNGVMLLQHRDTVILLFFDDDTYQCKYDIYICQWSLQYMFFFFIFSITKFNFNNFL